jgi:hypothetical protein
VTTDEALGVIDQLADTVWWCPPPPAGSRCCGGGGCRPSMGPMWTCPRLAPIASYTYDKAGWLTGTASSSAAHPWDADQEAMADTVLGQARTGIQTQCHVAEADHGG